jgi:hypothetical protein
MTQKIKNFYDLDAWRKAHDFVLEIYKKTKKFPKEELYGITSQLRRLPLLLQPISLRALADIIITTK